MPEQVSGCLLPDGAAADGAKVTLHFLDELGVDALQVKEPAPLAPDLERTLLA